MSKESPDQFPQNDGGSVAAGGDVRVRSLRKVSVCHDVWILLTGGDEAREKVRVGTGTSDMIVDLLGRPLDDFAGGMEPPDDGPKSFDAKIFVYSWDLPDLLLG